MADEGVGLANGTPEGGCAMRCDASTRQKDKAKIDWVGAAWGC